MEGAISRPGRGQRCWRKRWWNFIEECGSDCAVVHGSSLASQKPERSVLLVFGQPSGSSKTRKTWSCRWIRQGMMASKTPTKSFLNHNGSTNYVFHSQRGQSAHQEMLALTTTIGEQPRVSENQLKHTIHPGVAGRACGRISKFSSLCETSQ